MHQTQDHQHSLSLPTINQLISRSTRRLVRLFARIYTQSHYQLNREGLLKVFLVVAKVRPQKNEDINMKIRQTRLLCRLISRY